MLYYSSFLVDAGFEAKFVFFSPLLDLYCFENQLLSGCRIETETFLVFSSVSATLLTLVKEKYDNKVFESSCLKKVVNVLFPALALRLFCKKIQHGCEVTYDVCSTVECY